MRMAQGLLAGDMAVHEPEVARVPPEVLPVQFRIVDSHIVHLPESILGSDFRIVYLHILHILEDIFAVALEPVDIYVAAEHERICAAVELQVPGVDAGAPPEYLVGVIHHHILYVDVIHLPEHLRRIDHCAGHLEMVGIPERRAPADSEVAVPDSEAVHMPEGIVPLETASGSDNIAALLDGGLPFPYCNIVQMYIMDTEQRAFSPEFLIFYRLHNRFCFSLQIYIVLILS